MSESGGYRPIACGLHDRLEAIATTGGRVRIVARIPGTGRVTLEDRLVDVFARGGEEFVRTGRGDLIRLDHLESVDGVPFQGDDIRGSPLMTLRRMDNVLIVVEDLEAAKAFFVELGMELEGETIVEGEWVGRVIGLEDVRAAIAMMRTPDGQGRVELTRFNTPAAVRSGPANAPANALGIRRIMFAVEDIDDVVARLRRHGAELVGEVVRFEDQYRLCFIRGPEGIIIGLAEELGSMERPDVERWLSDYGRAWEGRDVDRFVGLFADDVRYFWTPFEEPRRGRDELGRAFAAATARQEAIRFTADVVGVSGSAAVAHWRCTFRRPDSGSEVHLDGMFMMEFDGHGRCAVFREWWHSDEGGDG